MRERQRERERERARERGRNRERRVSFPDSCVDFSLLTAFSLGENQTRNRALRITLRGQRREDSEDGLFAEAWTPAVW